MTAMSAPLRLDAIKQAPKALLHDHLDGGLRPATVIDIASQTGYDDLPATDVDELTPSRTADRWNATSSRSRTPSR